MTGLALGGSLARIRPASGEEPAEPIRLEVLSSGECPGPQIFEGLVRARTRRALFVTSGAAARSIEVEMHARPHAGGSMVLLRAGVVEGRRSVQAENCADVAEALALVVTLAIDPTASLDPAAAAASTAASPGASVAPLPPSPAATPGAPSASSSPPPRPPSAPLPPGPPSVVVPRAPARETPLPHTLWLGADFALASGVSRDALLGVAPGVGWRATGSAFFTPSVRLAFLRATTGAISSTQGAASFTWTVGRADGCFLSWPGGPARLLGCARLEVGALQGAGTAVASPQTANRAWVAAGPMAGVEWALLPPLFLRADVAGLVHVTEDRFYFRPDTTVYQVPVLGFEAGVGLGVHFL